MSNRRDYYDQYGKPTGHSEDSWQSSREQDIDWEHVRETGLVPGAMFPLQAAARKKKEEQEALLASWKKYYRLNFWLTVVGLSVVVLMVALAIIGAGNGFTGFLLVVSAIVAACGAWNLPKPYFDEG
jgi:hypothetical protein